MPRSAGPRRFGALCFLAYVAIAWASRCPAGDAKFIEVRQVFEMSDFPADVQKAGDSPAVRAQVEKHQKS